MGRMSLKGTTVNCIKVASHKKEKWKRGGRGGAEATTEGVDPVNRNFRQQ